MTDQGMRTEQVFVLWCGVLVPAKLALFTDGVWRYAPWWVRP